MRMWMVPPEKMCRKHLLGEHVELHMLAGCLRLGKSITGYVERGLVETASMENRHAALVGEMNRRGYHHKSPLVVAATEPVGKVSVEVSYEELVRRCPDCREMI